MNVEDDKLKTLARDTEELARLLRRYRGDGVEPEAFDQGFWLCSRILGDTVETILRMHRTWPEHQLIHDIDPVRIQEANANAKAAGVTHLVEFKLQDAMKTDVSDATVVTTFLLSASNLKLRPLLTKQLKPGSRIVAHNFSFGDWTPEKYDTFKDADGRTRTLYLYRADGKVRQ